jgi:hypothetical protein
MGTCRCDILNVLSGALARDLLETHLRPVRTDGMGRTIYLCDDSGVEWLQEHKRGGYDDEVTVLRRAQR